MATNELGKLSDKDLNSHVIDYVINTDSRVLVGPKSGEDCATIDLEDGLLSFTTDPITGAQKDLGKIGINICVNDIASNGVKPIGITITILAPLNSSMEQIARIMEDANNEAKKLNVSIVGGHTEITDAVNRFVLSLSAIGYKKKPARLLQLSNIKKGHSLIMTKWAAIEGTVIISNDVSMISDVINNEDQIVINTLKNSLSVLAEGIIGYEYGAVAMHDITEGGVIGGAFEMAKGSKLGVRVNKDLIPVLNVTKKFCDKLSIDPLKLISSGSMLIVCEKENELTLIKALNESSINATVIGQFNDTGVIEFYDNDSVNIIDELFKDELYKVL
jgi:hydrogenase maturation factor